MFRYAIATGRAERDPAADLASALAPVNSRNLPGITEPKRLAALLRAIDTYQVTGPTGYVFPSLLDPRRPMSENALTAALRRMG